MIILLFLTSREKYSPLKKYAVCVWGELRGIYSTKESFKKHVWDVLDADVYIVCQNFAHGVDTRCNNNEDVEKNNTIDDLNEERLQFMRDDPRVVYTKLYNKPSSEYLNIDRYESIPGNWKKESVLQQWMNFNTICDLIGDKLEEYEYVMFVRSDLRYVFDFPLIDKSDKVWCLDGQDYGGINYNLLMMSSKYIKTYLRCHCKYILDETVMKEFKNQRLNCESYVKFIIEHNGWELGYIEPNAFISADNEDEKTTCSIIKWSDEHKVFYKYWGHFKYVQDALEKWNNGNRYTLEDSMFKLV